jgi:hypothetical protein
MSGSSKKVRLSTASCPKCGKKGSLKKILFGMPGADFDHEKYIVGGRVISDIDPENGCSLCGWEGLRGKCSK